MSATLISNARIFNGVSVVTDSGHVLIESGRISRISLRDPLPIPEGCTVVDATGCTLLPGLIDAHVHVYQDVNLLETAIQYGVTTVLDMHNEPEWFQDISKVTKQRNDVSDVKSCGFGATIKDGWPAAIVKLVSQEPKVEERISKWPNLTDRASIEGFIARNRAAGASFTKLMQEDGHTMNLPFPTIPVPTPSVEIQRAIVDASHENGMLTIAHALTNHSTLSVLEAGVDGLAHASIEPINEQVVKAFKKNNAFLVPTLAVHASCSGEEQESREKFSANLEGTAKEHLLGCLHITREEFTIKNVYEQVFTLKEAGIDILCGTDTSTDLLGTRAGASVHHELWMYVNRCHFTPQEALISATSKTADRFKLADRGKIEEGRLADLLLVGGNPAESIDAIADIQGVWRNGERLARKM
ncbi:hypothetical protein N7509_005653 [Penicillium cosmopolitanum]|uniref:Amidohydrolase-related domain-containing protein n=1 Tax=Penicillium cosmopolitanum TaxID=1131564 RepID=A0A9W9W2T1_9EURO|nr:uncharacterized protein N7509_005653 [Penicillium cosmopolitanum]KAJ5397540.1 hypothetical protein N7509_005653 [Penicillium cosmopolitanum]